MTSVVIPWRAGCPHRERALEWVLGRYAATFPEFAVTIGGHSEGEWCKAAAVADGLSRVPDGTLIIADADVWIDDATALPAAIEALESHGWAIPHADVHRLNEAATEAFMVGAELPDDPYTEKPYHGWAGGGIVVTTTDTYRQAPLDRRFVGWGQEDASWAIALRTIAGVPWRGTAPLTHLFHPPQPRRSRRYGSTEGQALHRRYTRAQRRPDQMRAILEGAA